MNGQILVPIQRDVSFISRQAVVLRIHYTVHYTDRNRQSSLRARILMLHSLNHSLTHSEGQHSNLRLRGSRLQKGVRRLNTTHLHHQHCHLLLWRWNPTRQRTEHKEQHFEPTKTKKSGPILQARLLYRDFHHEKLRYCANLRLPIINRQPRHLAP